jgi:hypothetical protein
MLKLWMKPWATALMQMSGKLSCPVSAKAARMADLTQSRA